ncbi:LCP family protein [Candidatus Gottesmanbacteria bacterium]|nr:LCP family protein [Candidatus Gottesmanbacteria bacterium]
MQPKFKRLFGTRIKTVFAVFVATALVLFVARAAVVSLRFMRQTGITPGFALRILFNTGAPLRQIDYRTNILLLGISGGQHAGADLTDTMLVLSLNLRAHTMAMISVPRDIWSDTLKDKVNSAYHYGEEKKKGGGFLLAKTVVEDIVGVPIHYVFMIDFSGFRDIIDLVSGIDVNVPTAFTDPEFPIEGRENDLCGGDPTFACRYEPLHFDQGLQQMSGARALTYVRSRHAQGDEGSDFARSRRQQDVLLALKAKLVSPRIWFTQQPLAIFRALDDATETDMNIGELATVGKLLLRISEDRIKKISIEPLLESPPAWMYGKYVLVPKESFEVIHEFVKSQLD